MYFDNTKYYQCKKCLEKTNDPLKHARDFHPEKYKDMIKSLKELEECENGLEEIWKEKARLRAEYNKMMADIKDDINRMLSK